MLAFRICLGLLLLILSCNGERKDEITSKRIFPTKISIQNPQSSDNCHSKPMDCEEVQSNGKHSSGVYSIWPRNRNLGEAVKVYCDMKTDGGGWTVIQRRGDFGNSENYFNKTWKAYKKGFGNLQRDFWLGNDIIHALTNQGTYVVRFEMKLVNGSSAFALYDEFWIEDEERKYKLHISEYSGTAGDSMWYHDDKPFSTYDRDNQPSEHCARNRSSGWWFFRCLESNLNGLHKKGPYSSTYDDGIQWNTFGGNYCSLMSSEIKIRSYN